MDSGQLPAGIRQLRYAPARGADLGVEVLSFERLRRMDPEHHRTRPQRPDFHVLALVRSGEGRHEADFADHLLRPGSVVWIRPGTVHRWTDVDHVDGPLILFEPGFLPAPGPAAHAAADSFASSTWRLDGQARELALLAADHLSAEYAAALLEPAASPPLLAHLLAALVLRALPAEPAPAPVGQGRDREVFHRYRAAVERDFARHHHVDHYAQALGYDRRTLTRATRAATGLGAKQFLDRRILLEAQRLLAHTDLPAARCAERVGFTDAANFTAFFQRQTGLPPSRWRSAHCDRGS
ncbi:AraC family transcriptional regulator [Streptomyces decoyicus]|uniref:AraC family transcriptional regulator n=1 Tax=Streptomyces decoyicus TaxID=249567 RepID=A0ABZ1FSY1_9ACTN|nr:AraC family transcriptional regulator [Streptomyces decoyicus]WSB73603.1 AraC family transcriptional regulator [Streptomyces decoyicus]